MSLFFAAISYWLSESSGAEKPTQSYILETRGISFFLLFVATMMLILYLPGIIYLCKYERYKIKAFFTKKKVAGLVLGILAGGTALFQFIQVVLQTFHR
jgi:hypothetical protein